MNAPQHGRRWLAPIALAGLLSQHAVAQGVRCTTAAVSGGNVEIEVSTNDSTVEISVAGSGHVTSYPVPPGRKVTVPVPPHPGGTILFITVGRTLRTTRVCAVEIVEP